MSKKSKKVLEAIKNRVKLQEYWCRPSPYIQPKVTNVSIEELSVEKYINTVASHEFIEGGRQVPNRKPKY